MTESTSARHEEDAVMTTAMLKAMTHPIRRRIIRALPRLEYVRAADLVQELGEPANKISFHLRVLADAGLIVEAPEKARDRRDRVWTAVRGALALGSPEHPVEDEMLGAVLMRALVEDHHDLVRRVVAWAPEWVSGRTTEVNGTFMQSTVKLTSEQFEQMQIKIQEVIREAEAAHDPDDPQNRVWNVDLVAADDTL